MTTTSACSRAASIRLRCPAWSAPIVGTRPIGSPLLPRRLERGAEIGDGADDLDASSVRPQLSGPLGERLVEGPQLGRLLGERLEVKRDGLLVAAGDRPGQRLGAGVRPVGGGAKDERRQDLARDLRRRPTPSAAPPTPRARSGSSRPSTPRRGRRPGRPRERRTGASRAARRGARAIAALLGARAGDRARCAGQVGLRRSGSSGAGGARRSRNRRRPRRRVRPSPVAPLTWPTKVPGSSERSGGLARVADRVVGHAEEDDRRACRVELARARSTTSRPAARAAAAIEPPARPAPTTARRPGSAGAEEWWRRCGRVPVLARENPDGWCGGSAVLVLFRVHALWVAAPLKCSFPVMPMYEFDCDACGERFEDLVPAGTETHRMPPVRLRRHPPRPLGSGSALEAREDGRRRQAAGGAEREASRGDEGPVQGDAGRRRARRRRAGAPSRVDRERR